MGKSIFFDSKLNKRIRKDDELLKILAQHAEKHPHTIRRWFYTEDDNILRVDILCVIAAHYGLHSIDECLVLSPEGELA